MYGDTSDVALLYTENSIDVISTYMKRGRRRRRKRREKKESEKNLYK